MLQRLVSFIGGDLGRVLISEDEAFRLEAMLEALEDEPLVLEDEEGEED